MGEEFKFVSMVANWARLGVFWEISCNRVNKAEDVVMRCGSSQDVWSRALKRAAKEDRLRRWASAARYAMGVDRFMGTRSLCGERSERISLVERGAFGGFGAFYKIRHAPPSNDQPG